MPSASVWILHSSLVSPRFLCFIWSKGSNKAPQSCHLLSALNFLLLGLPNNTGLEVTKIMAKVPCKEDVIFRNSSFRKAVSRYVRCYSQVSLNFHEERKSALTIWCHCDSHTSTTTSFNKVSASRFLKLFLLNTYKRMDPTRPTRSSWVLLLDFKNRLWG